MAEVSIIIPVYNVENYLEACLDSVIHQTFSDMEIICVNDGSTDGSLAILTRYQERDSRIKVICKENQGASMARNNGLQIAAGKYIYFVDSDDCLEPDGIETMYFRAKKDELDVLVVSIKSFTEDKEFARLAEDKLDYYYLKGTYDTVGDGRSMMKQLIMNRSYRNMIAMGFYSKAFLDENEIRFIPGIVFEDVIYIWEIFMNAKRVGVLDDVVYRRRFREGSIMTEAKSIRHFNSAFYVYRWLKQYIKEHIDKIDDEILLMPVKKVKSSCMEYYSALSEEDKRKIKERMDPQEYMEFWIEIREDLWREKQVRKEILRIRELKEELKDARNALSAAKQEASAAKREASAAQKNCGQLQKEYDRIAARLERTEKQKEEIYHSAAYKAGNVMLYIPKKLKNMLKRTGM